MVIHYVSITPLSDLNTLSLLLYFFKSCNKYYYYPYFTREQTSLNILLPIIQLINDEDRISIHICLVSNTLSYIVFPDMLPSDAQIQWTTESFNTGAFTENKMLWERMHVIK